MKGKALFTKAESNTITELIQQKLQADAALQKKLRTKIRALGFYASDFGLGNGYTVKDFLRVVKVNGKGTIVTKLKQPVTSKNTGGSKRADSDEAYFLNLCDKILKTKGQRQHRFDFLTGDSGRPLPVDSYYPQHNLVIEYRERQHTEEVPFFNRKKTVSGVHRGEQRKIYDQRRRDMLPANGITLIEFDYTEFEHNRLKRLLRNEEKDLIAVKRKLKKFIKTTEDHFK